MGTLKIRNTDSPSAEWIALKQPPGVAQMNDVSILFPLATTKTDFDAYLLQAPLG